MDWNRRLLFFWVAAVAAFGSVSHADEESKPDSARSFLLGFTYQPYDWSEEAFSETYSFIADNSDMIFHYFDDGVPWGEALAETQYHPNVEKELTTRLKNRRINQGLALGVNFLAKNRRDLASYWGESDGQILPKEWAARRLGDPVTVAAYINYCRSMIQRFQPDYFIYGMEIDSHELAIQSDEFRDLESFVAKVYSALRNEFPDLPLVLTFALLPEGEMEQRRVMLKRLLPYTDIYAVSLYPYLFDGVGGQADKLPDNFLARVKDYAGDKPFAIAETGFNAKTWQLLTRFIWVPGSEASQAKYVARLLSEANTLDAEFVNWWVPRDLDALWKKMRNAGADPLWSQWNSNGLLDADGRSREGLRVWREWLAKPVTAR